MYNVFIINKLVLHTRHTHTLPQAVYKVYIYRRREELHMESIPSQMVSTYTEVEQHFLRI